MKTIRNLFTIIICILFFSCVQPQKITIFSTNKMIDYCLDKTKSGIQSLTYADSLPRNILKDQKQWNLVNVYDWCSGFWPGILWYAYEISEDSSILSNAKKFTNSLSPVLDVPVDNHDLGFMLFSSYGNGYRLTQDTSYRKFLLKAADSLATLYNPKVGTILSWPAMREKMGWPHNTIIDNMINLELLFWAAKNGGDHALYDIAVKHAVTCMNTLVRPDYTVYHVGVFDTIDGHFIKGVTHQGYADNSMWARGQGWGIYGYAMAYRETGKEEFLILSQKLADKFMERLPADGIPYWDFDDPAIPDSPKDASAAAVAASGMLEISTLTENIELKEKYKSFAINLLKNLSDDKYLSGDKNQAFLMHSTGHKPSGSEIDASIIYADYYYLEALVRLKKIEQNIPLYPDLAN